MHDKNDYLSSHKQIINVIKIKALGIKQDKIMLLFLSDTDCNTSSDGSVLYFLPKASEQLMSFTSLFHAHLPVHACVVRLHIVCVAC